MALVGKVLDVVRLAFERFVLMAYVGVQFDGAALQEFDRFRYILPALLQMDPECLKLLCRRDRDIVAFRDVRLLRYGALLSIRALLWS